MEVNKLVDIYENNEEKMKKAEKKHHFYKHACFLSVGLAIGSLAVYNFSNGKSESITEISILTFIGSSLATLYLKMTKDMYRNLIDIRKETLSKLSGKMTVEDLLAVKIRKIEMENLKEEIALSDKNFLKSNTKFKKIKI